MKTFAKESCRQAVVAGFPVLAFVLLAAYLIVETLRPGTLTAPAPETVSEAVAIGAAAQALELLADGEDVNVPGRVRAGFLDGTTRDVAPLEAAVLAGRPELVSLLLHVGAEPGRAPNALCLARVQLPQVVPMLVGSVRRERGVNGQAPTGEVGCGAETSGKPSSQPSSR